MEQSGVARGIDLTEACSTKNVSSVAADTMKNPFIHSWTALETRCSPELHTAIAEANVLSVCRAKYLASRICRASGCIIACHMKTEDEAAELLKQYTCWVERRTNCQVNKITPSGERKIRRAQKCWKQTALRFTLLQATHQREEVVDNE